MQVDSKYTATYYDIKANDESALAALYTKNYPKVEAFVIRNSGTADQARDIYQEAFITVWQHIQSNRFREQDTGSIHGYLYQVVKNKWLDYLRSSTFKKTAPLLDVMREEDLTGNTMDNETYEAQMQEEEKLQKTISAFGTLSDECRDMLRKFYFEKRSLRAITSKRPKAASCHPRIGRHDRCRRHLSHPTKKQWQKMGSRPDCSSDHRIWHQKVPKVIT